MEEEYYDDQGVQCWKCSGEGFVIVCIDDMCRGSGNCIHGDGEEICHICNGDGFYDE